MTIRQGEYSLSPAATEPIRRSVRRIPAAWRALAPAAAMLATLAGAAPAGACGADVDCVLGDRVYRIVSPATRPAGAAIGAIIFVHGYHGAAARVVRNRQLTGLAEELGVAFIAADAGAPEWNMPGAPTGDPNPASDETRYFQQVAADASRRFGLDRDRFVVAGFSSGGMMVWNLACALGDAFAGYVAMSGTFWRPLPKDCPGGAVNLIHLHGREDPVVPLHGRPIKDARQGDVFEAIDLMTRVGGYAPAGEDVEDGLDCTRRRNPDGKLLALCLRAGKHSFRTRDLVRAWREIGEVEGW